MYNQNRKKVFIFAFALFLISLLLFGYFSRRPQNNSKPELISTDSIDSFFRKKSKLRYDKDGNDIIANFTNVEVKTLKYIEAATVIRAEYPVTGERYLDRQIAMSVQNAINDFRYQKSDALSKIDDDKSALNIDFKLGKISNRIYSILLHFQEKDELKDNYVSGRYEAYQFDRFYKRFISLDELFKDSSLSVIKERTEKLINQSSSSAQIKLDDTTELRNILLSDYSMEVYIDENKLAASQLNLNPSTINYRSLDKDINFSIDDRNNFIFDPQLDPIVASYKPQFFTMPGAFDNWPANPEGKIKYVALSFNTAPTEEVTDETISLLKENEAGATFFINSNYAQGKEDLIKKLSNSGFEIGNQGSNDILMTTLGMDHMRADFASCDNFISEILGYTPKLTRSLYGDVDDRLLQSTSSRPFILWSVDAGDWQDNTNTSIVTRKVLDNVKAGSIILMQNSSSFSNLALKEVLSALKNESYRIVSISELYKIYHADLEPGITHYSVFDDQPELWDELIVKSKIASGMSEEEARETETTEIISKAVNMG